MTPDPSPQNTPPKNLSPEKYARLRAEAQAPFKGLRKFIYGAVGASGAIGAAVCLLALRHGMLPPNGGDRGESIYPKLVTEPVAAELEVALCLSFGFGGQNGVLALGGDR